MKKRLVFASLLAPLAMAVPLSHAEAQGRGSVSGYSSGATVGGRSYGGVIASPRGITRNTPAARAAPVVRPTPYVQPRPVLPPSNLTTSPRHGMIGDYQNNIGTVPPGTRATTVIPR